MSAFTDGLAFGQSLTGEKKDDKFDLLKMMQQGQHMMPAEGDAMAGESAMGGMSSMGGIGGEGMAIDPSILMLLGGV